MRHRIAFMGTPEFSIPALDALLRAGHDVCCVYTQPPRPAGRGKQVKPSPVHGFADAHGIEVRTPKSLKSPDQAGAFRALELDVAVVAAYGLILPPAFLTAPRLGCVNIHGSLLPRWRGAAPIQRAIMAGDRMTGVTIMEMEAGLDTGPMLLADQVTIGPHMTAGELHDRLAELGARLIVDTLAGLEEGSISPRPQPTEGITYANKIVKDETRIDWSRPAMEIDRMVRGLSPNPGAWFTIDGTRIRVLHTEVREPETSVEPDVRPGRVLDDRLTIACGRGALRLLKVQRAGKAATTADALLRGFPVPAGSTVG